MKLALTIILLIICVVMTVVIMMQEGKQAGLSGSFTGGSSDTYWSKNKGRSKEGTIVKITTILAILFMVVSLILNYKGLK